MAHLPSPLSAKEKDSFAYPTMKDRIPVILSKIVDHLNRNKTSLNEKFSGPDSEEELKSIIGAMSCLRYEVMTNKPAVPLTDSAADMIAWNQDLERQTEIEGGESPKWFNSPWLWMECYLYRRVQEAVLKSSCFRSLDVFEDQKQNAYHSSYKSISAMTMYLYGIMTDEDISDKDVDKYFKEMLQISLWGNKCDLSISAGHENNQTDDPLQQLDSLKPNILVDDTDNILQLLRKRKNFNGKGANVSIVLDNAGFEVMTDLCLAEFLLSCGLASSIQFHGKSMPWFVSDVTEKDVEWIFHQMSAVNHLAISRLSSAWKERIKNGTMTFEYDSFWTMAHPYSQMESLCPELYSKLSQSDLLIFKGDLNYRKLVGDLNWETTVEFSHSLQGFHPTAVCSLRTLKADVVVGLKSGQAEAVQAQDKDWMVNGNWAVISFDGQANK